MRLLCAIFAGLLSSVVASISFADPPVAGIVGWGVNGSGQTSGTRAFLPSTCATGLVNIAGNPLTNVVAIAAGYFHGLALKSDGTVVGWGSNHGGQAIGFETPQTETESGPVILKGNLLSNVVAIAAGNFSLALKDDGTVVAWGQNKVPERLTDVIAINARGFDSLAVKRDGTVVGWRSWPWGLTKIPNGLTNVVSAIVGGGDNYLQNLALQRDGSIVAWGNEAEKARLPLGLSHVVAIASGYNHSLALKGDGTVFGWGFNRSGQATGVAATGEPFISSGPVAVNGNTLSNVVAIAADEDYSLAVRSDGAVVAWGETRAYSPIPAKLSAVTKVVAARGFCLAITTNLIPFTAGQ